MDGFGKGVEGESVHQKIEDLFDYVNPILGRFPRPEKGYEGLAIKIKGSINQMTDCESNTHLCFYPKSLLKELNELDKSIQQAKRYVNRAYRQKLLTPKQFEIISDYLSQIGKMTGSWKAKVGSRL